MKTFFKLALACSMAALELSAIAAPIVDQQNQQSGGGFCFTAAGDNCGQSFRPDHSNISGAGFHVSPYYAASGNGTVTLSIFSGYDGAPMGLIASGTASNINMNSGWVDVFFAPAAITIDNEYYLIIQSTNSVVASLGASYADGNAVLAGWPYWSDLSFRTYYENYVTDVPEPGNEVPDPVTAVPEPGSFALLGLGIAGLGLARRKKRSQ